MDLCVKTEENEIKTEEIDIKTEDDESADPHACDSLTEDNQGTNVQPAEKTPEQTVLNFCLNQKNYEDSSEGTALQCEFCLYVTFLKANLKRHMLIHKTSRTPEIFSCDLCPFTTKYGENLKLHILKHKYSNELCSETKQVALKNHMLVPKNPTFIHYQRSLIFKCGLCSFTTKYKNSFQAHLGRHKDSFELMYHCEFCSFESKYKGNLRGHMLTTHKNSYEVQRYRCELCKSDFIYKAHFKKHILTHKMSFRGYRVQLKRVSLKRTKKCRNIRANKGLLKKPI